MSHPLICSLNVAGDWKEWMEVPHVHPTPHCIVGITFRFSKILTIYTPIDSQLHEKLSSVLEIAKYQI